MKPKKILVLTYWSFDNALIQTYTLPYVTQIRNTIGENGKIYLFTLSQNKGYNKEYQNQIEALKTKNIYVLNFSYRKFGLFMTLKMLIILKYLIVFSFMKRIHVIHAWCTPGGAMGYIISVFTGKKLILDSFEPHAETMAESKTWSRNSLAYKLLFKLEKLQLKRAKEVICAAPGMISHSQELYGITKTRYFVKPACVDLNLFNPDTVLTPSEKLPALKSRVCVYAGKFGGIYLEKEVFDFFKAAYDYWNRDFTVLLLTSHSDEEILDYCRLSELPTEVIVKRFVPHNQVPAYMRFGTFGFCPVKPMESKKYCSPIKNGEYWAMGLPVVITKNISADSDLIAQNNIGYVLNELNRKEYEKAFKALDQILSENNLSNKIRRFAMETRNFKVSEKIYQTIYG